MVSIREATDSDLKAVLSVVRAAFEASEEADSVVQLVTDALHDSTATPSISLLAFDSDCAADAAVGHILFTKAHLTTHPNCHVALLAPLAVVPAFQKQGIGSQLIEEGMNRLASQGVELVFVTGHPSYYPRHGFQPANSFGFEPPFPDPDHPDSWMVRELQSGALAKYSGGKLECAESIDRPEYWQ